MAAGARLQQALGHLDEAPAAVARGDVGGACARRCNCDWMLATPTEMGKYANMGSSFGESPMKRVVSRARSVSTPNSRSNSVRVMVSLSYSPNQPLTWMELTLAWAPASSKMRTMRPICASGSGGTSSQKSMARSATR
ncbi:hypothetical protein AD428_20015 [Achromobacter sp. DMS1]|nr:hypothetical protein AD428_20015 [Achromobacter sp. DMS1]